MKKDNNWVSIKDELPKFSTSCLVYKRGKIPDIEIACLGSIDEKGANFIVPFSGRKEIEFNSAITHWMYLPDSPLIKSITYNYHTLIEPICDGKQTVVTQYKVVGQDGCMPNILFVVTFNECSEWKLKNCK